MQKVIPGVKLIKSHPGNTHRWIKCCTSIHHAVEAVFLQKVRNLSELSRNAELLITSEL